MERIDIDIDAEACAAVMRRYELATQREAVNFALRTLAAEAASLEEARAARQWLGGGSRRHAFRPDGSAAGERGL